MRSKGFHRICLLSILVAFFWCVSTEEEYTCPYDIHVNKGQIIEARESVSNGAMFLKHSYVRNAKECYKLCCERKNCDLAQMQYKNSSTVGFFPQIDKICFMFRCGKPSKCRFGEHDHYATIAYDRPDEELSHLDSNHYEGPSVKVGKAKWNSAKESQYKPSVTEGNDKEKDVGVKPDKPSFRQTVKEQEHNQEDKDLSSSWKPKHEEENAEHSKTVKEFGEPRYHNKDTKEPSKTVKEEEKFTGKSKESEKPSYQEMFKEHLERPSEHVQVKTRRPVTVPVQKATHKQTVQNPKQEDVDDTDADLERKLEELTPSNNHYEEPAGHVVKEIPTKKPTTYHHWRQFVDNNPDFPYTIPMEVKETTSEPTTKKWHKPSTERRTTAKMMTMKQPVRTEPPKITEKPTTEKPTTEKPATQKPMTPEAPHSKLPILEVPIQSKNISDVVVIETHRLKIIENKAVLPLAIFLVLAILLLFVVALRLRIVKSKLKRRPFATDDADYLINGMYL